MFGSLQEWVNNMKRYIDTYMTLLRLNFSNLMVFRGNLINNVVGSVVWGSFHFISILLLTSRTPSLYGWSRDELILLTASFSFLWGFFHIFLARNFERMSEIINLGELDGILLKPIDSQFLLSTNTVNFTGLVRVTLGVVALIIVSQRAYISFTFIQIGLYLLLVMCGILLIYSIWFSVTTMIIWFPRLTNLVEFLFMISGLSRYPPDMIRGFNNSLLLFLLPITIFVSTPTKALINRLTVGDVLILLFFTSILFVFSRAFWKFALRYYTSASS